MGERGRAGRGTPGEAEPGAEELATALAGLARDLLGQVSVQATLERIVSASIEMVQGCTDAGILVVHRGRARPLVVSSPLARDSDELQGCLGEGPCFEAAGSGHRFLRIGDLTRASQRWPRFAPAAHRLGIGSMMAFLLFTDTDTDDPDGPNLGALNLYARTPGGLTDRSEQVGLLLASHAAVALAAARSEEGLHAAVSSRQVIGEAVGILMERHKITRDQAFAMLSRVSQNRNVKLRQLAQQLTETGELTGDN